MAMNIRLERAIDWQHRDCGNVVVRAGRQLINCWWSSSISARCSISLLFGGCLGDFVADVVHMSVHISPHDQEVQHVHC